MKGVAVIVTAVVACTLGGCSSSPTSSVNLDERISFREDIAPVLATHCGGAGDCHGSANGANVYLGAPVSQATATRALLLGNKPLELPAMPFVTPGDPSQSFLFHKVQGSQQDLEGCGGQLYCGTRMPKGGEPLDPLFITSMRQWIEQGALDN